MHNSTRIFFAGLSLILCGSLTSCGSQKFSWGSQTAKAIQDGSVDHLAQISLFSGEALSAYNIIVRKDSTRWFAASDAEMMTAPTDEISSVRISTPMTLSGAITGAVPGILLGTALGALGSATEVVHTSLSDLTSKQPPPPTAFPIGYPIVGGLLGGTIGGLIGGGHKTLYVATSSSVK
jgi:hypothetical protein